MPSPDSAAQFEFLWGLKRKLIAYRDPPKVRRGEACSAGLLFGCGLAAIWFLLAAAGLPGWAGIALADWPRKYLITGATILMVPALLGLLAPLGWLNEHDAPWQSGIWMAIVHLRDDRYFRGVDWFLRIMVPGLYLYARWHLHLPWIGASGLSGMYLIAPLAGGVALTSWVLLFVPPTSFFFRKDQESKARWVLQELLGTEAWEAELQRRKRGAQAGVEPKPQPCDPHPSFVRTLSYELSEEFRAVGVAVPAEFPAWVRQIREKYGGALYQSEQFTGTVRMVRCWELPGGAMLIPALRSLTNQIATRALWAGWSRPRLAAEVLAFVQREIRYAPDDASTGVGEYGRFPLETLIEGHGDCECTALLCAALLCYLGFGSALLVMPSHAAVGLRIEKDWENEPALFDWTRCELLRAGKDSYFFGETAVDGEPWPRWGTIPADLLAGIAKTRIIIIPSAPLPEAGES